MTTKPCPHCGEDELRREHRPPWMKALAYVVPLRPQICAACDTRTWTPLQVGDGLLPWVSSLTFWALLLFLGWVALQAPQAAGGSSPPVPATASAGPGLEPDATPDTTPDALSEVEPVPESAAEPAALAATPVATIESTAEPGAAATAMPVATTAPAAPVGKLQLRSLEVTRKGKSLEIVLDSSAAELQYRRSRFTKGQVFDLPGAWVLPRGIKLSRDFEQSNLAQLRLGLHEDHLRLVLELRDRKGAAPRVEREGGRLRIEIP